jgi:hypothetical protein
MRWEDIKEQLPQLAQLAHDRLIAPGVLLVGTIRADGTPRISPVEPFILDGNLWLSMMWRSRKALDLGRDYRVLLHSVVSNRDGGEGELKLRGRAIAEHEEATRRRYCEAVAVLGWQPEEPLFHLFRVEIGDLTYVRYAPSGDQHVVQWPPPQEFVRRTTSATSVGPPEPAPDLLKE